MVLETVAYRRGGCRHLAKACRRETAFGARLPRARLHIAKRGSRRRPRRLRAAIPRMQNRGAVRYAHRIHRLREQLGLPHLRGIGGQMREQGLERIALPDISARHLLSGESVEALAQRRLRLSLHAAVLGPLDRQTRRVIRLRPTKRYGKRPRIHARVHRVLRARHMRQGLGALGHAPARTGAAIMLEGALLSILGPHGRLLGPLRQLLYLLGLVKRVFASLLGASVLLRHPDILDGIGHQQSERRVIGPVRSVSLRNRCRAGRRQKREGLLNARQALGSGLRERITGICHACAGLEQLGAHALPARNAARDDPQTRRGQAGQR